ISRKHEIRITQPGWIDVAGGKLTTHPFMGEEVVDKLDSKLPPSRTAGAPLLPRSDTAVSGLVSPPVAAAVVQRCCREEWAMHLDDVLLRRTSWHFYHRNQKEIAEAVADWMAKELAWDDAQIQREIERYFRTAEFIG